MSALWCIAAIELAQFLWMVKADRNRAILEYNNKVLLDTIRTLKDERAYLNLRLTPDTGELAEKQKGDLRP
jgi:hypothetical protein